MITRRVVRRVTKRAYDKYSFVDYSASTDNLNPLNPTALEAQYAEIRQAVRGKLIEAYNQAKVQVPEDLLEYDPSPSQMLNDLNDLINKTKKNQLSALLDKIGGSPDLVSSILAGGDLDFFDNPPRLDCDGVDLFGGGNGNGDDSGEDDDPDNDPNKKPGDTKPGDSNDDDLGNATVTYHNVQNNEDKTNEWKTTFSELEFPLLPSHLGNDGSVGEYPEGQCFEGWYLDSDFSEKMTRVNFPGDGKNIDIYLHFIKEPGKVIIRYNKILGDEDKVSKWRTEFSELDFPLPVNTLGTNGRAFYCPDGEIFEGWYLDSYFSDKVGSTIPYGAGVVEVKEEEEDDNDEVKKDVRIINVYAHFVKEDDLPDDPYDTPPSTDVGDDDDDDTCDLINLSWLKIILIIVTVLGILVKVLVLIQNIMKAIADIAKDAQLCWINPPSLQSLISYVMQRLGAVIFQIVGMILLKLWAMLNLDCLSDMTMNVIEEINAALSNLMSAIAEVESTALDFKGAGGDLASSIMEMIKNLKEEMIQQAQNLKDTFTNMKDTLTSQAEWQKLGQELADVYSNPQTYLEMVPPEIKAKVLQAIDTYENTKKTVTNIINTQKAIFSKKNKEEDPTPALPRNVEMTYL